MVHDRLVKFFLELAVTVATRCQALFHGRGLVGGNHGAIQLQGNVLVKFLLGRLDRLGVGHDRHDFFAGRFLGPKNLDDVVVAFGHLATVNTR